MPKVSSKDEFFQSVVNLYTIEGAWERWADYRKRVTDYIIKNTDPGKTMAILGVGESNDLDIKRLYEHIGNLTLVDKNTDSMKKAVAKYGLTDEININIVNEDFVGIADADYKDIIGICLFDLKRMKEMFSPMVTGPKVIKKLDEIYGKINMKKVNLGIAPHDYVVVIGVHSQLNGFIEHVWNIIMQVVGRRSIDYSKVVERVMQQNDLFIPRFNDAIMDATKERAFIGIEIFEEDRNGCLSGVQGAQQTALYINKHIPEEELVMYQDEWPFSENCSYHMGIFNITK